jgi:tartrate-resistant acid phosphatase type 5
MMRSQLRIGSVQRPSGTPAVFLVMALLLLLAVQLVAQNAVPQDGAGHLNFLVISDWGGKGGTTQVAVAKSMGLVAAEQKSSFVVTCGDNYHANGISSVDSPRWKTEYEDIYSNPSLMIPWYVTLGNHDNRGSVQAEIDYSKISQRWKLPARYYTHTERIDGANEALFVHMDTSPFVASYRKKGSPYRVQGQDPKAQVRWLESVLGESRARWKIVVGHHPIYAAAGAHGDTKELVADVLPVLEKYGVRVYFCGHDHVLQHLVHGKLNLFVCGGGATHRAVKERADVKFGAGSAGFLAMTLTAGSAEAAYIDDRGRELYRTRITAR